MKVEVHNLHQSQPVVIENVLNTYQKGDLYCVLQADGTVCKFPIMHVFRIKEYKSVEASSIKPPTR